MSEDYFKTWATPLWMNQDERWSCIKDRNEFITVIRLLSLPCLLFSYPSSMLFSACVLNTHNSDTLLSSNKGLLAKQTAHPPSAAVSPVHTATKDPSNTATFGSRRRGILLTKELVAVCDCWRRCGGEW